MDRKTERIYASAPLDGTTAMTTSQSLTDAIIALGKEGQRLERIVLFDTLEVSVERATADDRTIMEALTRTSQTFVSIEVSAEAVSLAEIQAEVSETEGAKN